MPCSSATNGSAYIFLYPQRGTAGAEIKVRTFKNSAMTFYLLLKPGVGQTRTMHVFPIAWNFFLVLISTFLFHSSSFFLFYFNSSPYLMTAFSLG